MKAVILAGGLGTRLKPLTQVIPKPLIPISDEKTVLEIQITNLRKHGVREIYLATNYKAELIESCLGDGSKYGVQLFYSREEKPLGTCGPLSLLREELHEPFILMNGDILTELDFSVFYKEASQNYCDLTVVTREVVTPFDFGSVLLEKNQIVGVEEKPDLRFIIIAGIYLIRPTVFENIPDNTYFGMDDLIRIYLKKKIPIASYLTTAYWIDIGRMDNLNEAIEKYKEDFKNDDILSRICESGRVPSS